MSETIKGHEYDGKSCAETRKAKRLRAKRKTEIISIQEYEAQEPEQPPAESEDK